MSALRLSLTIGKAFPAYTAPLHRPELGTLFSSSPRTASSSIQDLQLFGAGEVTTAAVTHAYLVKILYC